MSPRSHRVPAMALALVAITACVGDVDSADTRAGEWAFGMGALVGDSACASCHEEIVAAFHRTNKHRSISSFEIADAPENLADPAVVYNEATNLYYVAFARGDTLFQREFRTDSSGRVVHERVHAAARVVGSGNATRSYLMNVAGHVTQMPLTWYVERERWDMSPGYEDANDRFGRRISVACMSCHNAVPEHTPGTQNHYTTIPDGIGCERCHGAGKAHVDARSSSSAPTPDAPDSTIVNPARLSRGAQLAVCQQCHLAGITLFPDGHGPTTFVPGRELARQRTVFVPEPQLSDPEWVGIDSHPLRLARSACYRSAEMTCSTCHDPHRPAAELEPTHYRDRCVGCHGDALASGEPEPEGPICSRPGVSSPEQAMTGDCAGCHMSRGGTSDVPHVTFTDHWIRRHPGPPRDPSLGRPAFEGTDAIELVALQAEGQPSWQLTPRVSTTPGHRLEEAAAYWEFYETMHRHPSYPPKVVALARAGLDGGGDRLDARIALGRALAEMDSAAAAERVLEAAAEAYPDDPWVHFWLGSVIDEAGRPREAVRPLRRAVDLQPLLLEARVKLADALYRAGRGEEALVELEAVVDENPVAWPRAWHNLGVIRMERGEGEAAVVAFAEASRLDPDLLDAHLQLGTLLLARGRLDEAETAFRRAMAAAPAHPASLGSMAVLHLARGDTVRARTLLERVLELEPGNGPARQLLAEIGRAPAPPS